MRKSHCQLCGCEMEPKAIERYHIVPREIMEEAGGQRLKTLRLCHSCREELERWYATKVADVTYDTLTKRFRSRSPQEMVKEYETAYKQFALHKKGQQRLL
jgi:hypothetical protein